MAKEIKRGVNTLKRALSKNIRKSGAKVKDDYELIRDKASEAADSVKEKVQDLYEGSPPYKEYLENVESFTKKNPLIGLSIAFALGILISKLTD